MKKITLVLCLSFVGLVGMAQQTESSKNLTDFSIIENSIIIRLNDHQEVVTIEKTLINSRDFNRSVEINYNNHELVHNTTTTSKYDFKLNQEAFTYEDGIVYNDYTINYDMEPMIDGFEMATV